MDYNYHLILCRLKYVENALIRLINEWRNKSMSLGLPNKDMEIFNATQDAIEKLLPSAELGDLCRKMSSPWCTDNTCTGSCSFTCAGSTM